MKRGLILAGGIAVLAVLAFLLRGRSAAPPGGGTPGSSWAPKNPNPAGTPVAADASAPKPPMDPVIVTWRNAIRQRRAQEVTSCQNAFLSHRDRFHPLLVDLVRTDKVWRIRSFTTRVLGRMKVKGDGPLLVQLLATDENEYVRANAAWALGELGDPAAGEALEKAKKDTAPNVRKEVAAALDKLGKAR